MRVSSWGMGYHIVHGEEHAYEERPGHLGQPPRLSADVTSPAGLLQSRARIWRYPPRTRGRRHKDLGQEEVFVVLDGTLTMLLGDPFERVDLAPRSVVSVEPGTALQLRNETDDEVVLFAYGAPPIVGKSEFLEDVGDL
jgi:mannose-6-phosphate isomerase-like protein (cupin superfamily)